MSLQETSKSVEFLLRIICLLSLLVLIMTYVIVRLTCYDSGDAWKEMILPVITGFCGQIVAFLIVFYFSKNARARQDELQAAHLSEAVIKKLDERIGDVRDEINTSLIKTFFEKGHFVYKHSVDDQKDKSAETVKEPTTPNRSKSSNKVRNNL